MLIPFWSNCKINTTSSSGVSLSLNGNRTVAAMTCGDRIFVWVTNFVCLASFIFCSKKVQNVFQSPFLTRKSARRVNFTPESADLATSEKKQHAEDNGAENGKSESTRMLVMRQYCGRWERNKVMERLINCSSFLYASPCYRLLSMSLLISLSLAVLFLCEFPRSLFQKV